MSNEQKLKQMTFRVAFLMPHQSVSEDLELEAMALMPVNEDVPVNKESAEYLAGASDAIRMLLKFLKQKGPRI